MKNAIIQQADFYINPTQEELDKLTRELDSYLLQNLINTSTYEFVIKKAKEYLKDVGNEKS